MKYNDLVPVLTVEGNYKDFKKSLFKYPKVIVITGKRRSGKTALAFRIAENLTKKLKKTPYVLNFPTDNLPKKFKKKYSIEFVPIDSIVLIDEAGILFHQRETRKKTHVNLSKLLQICSQKNLHTITTVQNSANIDIDVLRQTDIFMIKKPSLFQLKFERKALKDLFLKAEKYFEKVNPNNQNAFVYVFSDEFEGLLKFSLPSFWKDEISYAWKNVKIW